MPNAFPTAKFAFKIFAVEVTGVLDVLFPVEIVVANCVSGVTLIDSAACPV